MTMTACAQFGASVGAESDYRYRGVSLSDSKPSPRLTLNYDAPERWYAGASVARAALTQHTCTQWLGYAGWSTQTVDGRSFEFGIDASQFTCIRGYAFAEAYAGLLAERWSARLYYAPNYYGKHVPVSYAEFNAQVSIDGSARLFTHVGAFVALGGAGSGTRGDISVGGGVALCSWDLHLATVVASRGGPYPAVYYGAARRARRRRFVLFLNHRLPSREPFGIGPALTVTAMCETYGERSTEEMSMFSSHKILTRATAVLATLVIAACGGGGSMGSVKSGFVSTNLVSNVRAANNPYSGANVDANLVNAGASPSIRRASYGSPTMARRRRRSMTATECRNHSSWPFHRAAPAAPIPRASSSTARRAFRCRKVRRRRRVPSSSPVRLERFRDGRRRST